MYKNIVDGVNDPDITIDVYFHHCNPKVFKSVMMENIGSYGIFYVITGFEDTRVKSSLNILVTDCWASYIKPNAASRQLCTAPLLRKLNYLTQKYKSSTWTERMSQLILKALNLRNENNITRVNVDEILKSFSNLIIEPLDKELDDVVTFQKRMVRYSEHVFNFLLNKDVPPDNNGSEIVISNFKVKLKISSFFKSLEVARRYACIRTVIDTSIKNNRNPLQIIRLIAQCRIATE